MRKPNFRFTEEETQYLMKVMNQQGYARIFREKYPHRDEKSIFNKRSRLIKENVIPLDRQKGDLVILEAEKKMWTIYFSNSSRISCLADGLEAAIELINPKLKRNIISARSAADKD